VLPAPDGLEVELADDSREALVYRAAMTPTSESEFRLALWNSPMGRLYYARAEAEAMLGREGLVHGGHSLGVGVATTAIATARRRASGSSPTAEVVAAHRGREVRGRGRGLVRGGDPYGLSSWPTEAPSGTAMASPGPSTASRPPTTALASMFESRPADEPRRRGRS